MLPRIMSMLMLLPLAMIGSTGAAGAQAAFPDKPIRIIVPFTPGTGIDILARTLGQKMGEDWKIAPQEVAEVVVNLLRHDPRSLPSRVELRPAKPRK